MAVAIGATLIGAELASVAVIGAITVGHVVGTAVILGVSIGLQFALSPNSANAEKNELPAPADGTTTLRQSILARAGAYGRCRMAGGYVLYEAVNGTAIDVIALVSGKISQVRQFYLNDDEAVLGEGLGVNQVQPEGDGAYGRGRIHIYHRLGLDTETAYPQVVAQLGGAGIWTSAHRGDGVASIAVLAQQDTQEFHHKVYPHGEPKTSAEIDAYAVWDFRDAAQDPDDPATWTTYPAWSEATAYAAGERVLRHGVVYISGEDGNLEDPDLQNGAWISAWSNPVLQLVDYLTNTVPQRTGMRLNRDILIMPVLDHLRRQADLCDVLVELDGGGFEPRYRSDGFFSFDTDPQNVVGAILSTCDGWLCEDFDGTLALQVGSFEEFLDEAGLVGIAGLSKRHIIDFSIDCGIADEEEINEIPFSFTSPSLRYSEVPGDPWRDEAAIGLTGVVRSQPMSLTWVQSHAQARRLAKRAMERVQTTKRGEIVTTLYGMSVVGKRWIAMTDDRMGFAGQVVEIQSAEIDLKAGRCTFKWIAVDGETMDDWNPADDEGGGPPDVDVIEPGPQYVPANIAGTVGGSPAVRFDISWDYPGRDDYDYRVRFRQVDDGSGNPGPWNQRDFADPTISAGRVLASVFPTTAGLYEIQVASIGAKGSLSDWSDTLFLDMAVGPSLDFRYPHNSMYLPVVM